jgi:hypothetical protein
MMEVRQDSSAYGGQFDSSTNTYLLPPLIGLPYSDMVKNGLHSRCFRAMAGWYANGSIQEWETEGPTITNTTD